MNPKVCSRIPAANCLSRRRENDFDAPGCGMGPVLQQDVQVAAAVGIFFDLLDHLVDLVLFCLGWRVEFT